MAVVRMCFALGMNLAEHSSSSAKSLLSKDVFSVGPWL